MFEQPAGMWCEWQYVGDFMAVTVSNRSPRSETFHQHKLSPIAYIIPDIDIAKFSNLSFQWTSNDNLYDTAI